MVIIGQPTIVYVKMKRSRADYFLLIFNKTPYVPAVANLLHPASRIAAEVEAQLFVITSHGQLHNPTPHNVPF